jgi:hypothetical protein
MIMNPIIDNIPLIDYILFLNTSFYDNGSNLSSIWYDLVFMEIFFFSTSLYNLYSSAFDCDYDSLLINED